MTDRVRVSVLGATGSVGVSTLDVVCGRAAGAPEFDVVALAANTNVDALANAAIKSRAELAVIAEPSLHGRLKLLLDGTGIEAAAGVPSAAHDLLADAARTLAEAGVGLDSEVGRRLVSLREQLGFAAGGGAS